MGPYTTRPADVFLSGCWSLGPKSTRSWAETRDLGCWWVLALGYRAFLGSRKKCVHTEDFYHVLSPKTVKEAGDIANIPSIPRDVGSPRGNFLRQDNGG